MEINKIGIITWFRYENYGTILQAIALQNFLKNEGYNVELINFELQDYKLIKKKKKNFKNEFFERLMYKLYNYDRKKFKQIYDKKSIDFRRIIDKNCILSKRINCEKDYISVCKNYDCIIAGSDQIWNPNWYHPFYYANYEQIKSKLIAYAPSIGVNAIEDDVRDKIINALKRFSHIGLREKNSVEYLKKYVDLSIENVCDPTLLLNREEWSDFEERIVIPEKYVLCYFLSDNIKHWKAAKKYAKKHRLKLVVIPQKGYSLLQSKYIYRDCNVGNFLYLIKNAECIITDSFHCTIFSLLYEKEFVLFERHDPLDAQAQNTRLYNLIETLNLDNNMVRYNTSKIDEIETINYSVVREKLNNLIKHSKEFLENSLVGGK